MRGIDNKPNSWVQGGSKMTPACCNTGSNDIDSNVDSVTVTVIK